MKGFASQPITLRHVLYLHRLDIIDLHRRHVEQFFAERFPGVDLTFSDGSHNPSRVDVDCVIAPAAPWIVPAVESLPSLKWIHFSGSGTDAVQEFLTRRPAVIVSKSSDVMAIAMAEYAIAGMLYFAKDIDRFSTQQRTRSWTRSWLREICGHHLVILGAGAVAEALAPRAEGLGLRVTAVARTARPHRHFPNVASIEALPKILPSTDFLVCCLPLTPSTRGLIGAQEFRVLPARAVLINIARGGIVDEAALYEALIERRLRGAVMDVFEVEPLAKDSPLWQCPSLLITPHVAGTSDRFLSRMLESFEANWKLLQSTGRPATPVDTRRGY